jgi:uncharacterized membrane protein YdjX (TVP38/TMEM64 family)
MNKIKNNKVACAKFLIFIILFASTVLVAINLTPWVIELTKNPTDIRSHMLSNGIMGYLMFISLQILHVIIAFIPGDVFYILGGFVFGTPLGFLLSWSGIMLGSILVFNFSRLLGKDFVNVFVSKEKIDKISNVLNSTKGMIGLFVICLIPMIPKDPLIYAAGLTPVKASRLFLVYGISRIPTVLMLVMIGANTYDQNYSQGLILIGILVLSSIIVYIMKKRNKHLKALEGLE